MADYITPDGYEKLKTEHQALWTRRREVVAALSAAAAEGDRSENAEYIYRKKELREVDRRLRYVGRRLEELVAVDQLPDDRERVFFGAWVDVEDESGVVNTYRIVGADETDAAAGWISLRSPMARALLGKRLDDEVSVRLPDARKQLVIIDIRYPDP